VTGDFLSGVISGCVPLRQYRIMMIILPRWKGFAVIYVRLMTKRIRRG
jgi:hypothetical protein